MKFSWLKKQPIICSAPMHGITNSAQRQIFKYYGADVVFSEMVSSMGINYANQKTKHKTGFHHKEKPIIIQIFGNSLAETVIAAQSAEKIGADGIDFNCGCPAKSMIASGNGGRLLQEPETLIKILKKIKQSIRLPLSLKTRIGYDQILPPSFYQKIAEKSDIDCLIIHGRTVKQMYRGYADWNHIKKISDLLPIPVIGSGDIVNAHQAVDRVINYSPAGIMIGRGALGNPWIFNQTKSLLSKKIIRPRFSYKKITRTIHRHLNLIIKEFRHSPYYTQKFTPAEIEIHAIHNMRKHFGWYLKGFPGAKEIRRKLLLCNHKTEIDQILNSLIK